MTEKNEKVQKMIDARIARLKALGAPAHIIEAESSAENIARVTRWVEAEELARLPETISRFCAAHPGFVERPDEPGTWSSPEPLNQRDLDAWDREEQDQRAHLRAITASTAPGQRTELPDGSVWERQAVFADDVMVEADSVRVAWALITPGAHAQVRPERDFGTTTIIEWLLSTDA